LILREYIDKANNKPIANMSNRRNQEDEEQVKRLNREIMVIFEKRATPFGYASAALLSVLYFISEKHVKVHPENRSILIDYFKKEFDRFLNKLSV
jgi:hypothetical protein